MRTYKITFSNQAIRTIRAQGFHSEPGGALIFYDESNVAIALFRDVVSVESVDEKTDFSTVNTSGVPAAAPCGTIGDPGGSCSSLGAS